MKNLKPNFGLFIFLLLISVSSANAQLSQNKWYGSFELYFNTTGINLNVNHNLNNAINLRAGFSSFTQKDYKKPYDYYSLLNYKSPYYSIHNFQIGISIKTKLNREGTIRLNLFTGSAYSILEEPDNYRLSDYFNTNSHSWNVKKSNTISLVINPNIEFLIGKNQGLSLSSMIILNKNRRYIGLGIGHVFGKRTKRAFLLY